MAVLNLSVVSFFWGGVILVVLSELLAVYLMNVECCFYPNLPQHDYGRKGLEKLSK